MRSRPSLYALQALACAGGANAIVNYSHPALLTDINEISKNWGQISPYVENAADVFGVEDVGVPDGCQIEQVHTMQRHAHRFPIHWVDDGDNNLAFAYKLSNWSAAANSSGAFDGPLAFLNTYRYRLPSTGLLTGQGAVEEMKRGVTFWNQYGRTLYDAADGQLAYDPKFPNGTAREKPLLRTTSQSRMYNSMLNWAIGFFGPSFQEVPDQSMPTLGNWTDNFDVLVIPEGGTENNTLASYDSCFNSVEDNIGNIGDLMVFDYLHVYLPDATKRLQRYAPSGFTLSVNDTYAMQAICAYEMQYMGQSDFCGLFTADEWAGFENTLEIAYYYDYTWGNPTGRAQGIGLVQELLARLQNQYITSSNSSVNSTVTDNAEDFPLGRLFYADFTHDDILVSVLNALSVDYFYDPPTLTDFPPNPSRHFHLSKLTPFGANLITEVIGCSSADPTPVKEHRTAYYPEQYGYSAANATYKFVRMRLNDGIVPLESIRGGLCKGRTDGFCALDKFIESQKGAYELSNYDYACFGNYTLEEPTSGKDYDGTISEQ